MRITTWNVNGLRAALRKGLLQHLDTLRPDVVLLQEVRVNAAQHPDIADPWQVTLHAAQKPGYAGTAIWTRNQTLESVSRGLSADDSDVDGRVLRGVVGDVELVCIYAPSGSAGEASQARKDAFMLAFGPLARELIAAPHPVLLAGDLNVAPTENDLHDPRGNKNRAGFLPHERQWFQDLLTLGWTDLLRAKHGEGKGPYTWWSNFGKARAEDRGWRIDHVLGNPALARRVTDVSIHRAGGLEVSDHAPVTLTVS